MQNLIWFRADLRSMDNPALQAALVNPKTKTLAVFVITEQQWHTHDWGTNKIGFVLNSVLSLQQELQALNIPLLILECATFQQIPALLVKTAQQYQCDKIYFNHEYELNERQRDAAVTSLCAKHQIQTLSFDDQCLLAPGSVLTQQQTPYTVFTPFKKACYARLPTGEFAYPKLKIQALAPDIISTNILDKYKKYIDNPLLKSWPAGSKAGLNLLHNFVSKKISSYQIERDFPALNSTSKLSAYLAVGAVSVRQCYNAAISQNAHEFSSGNAGVVCWISELLWRDFYRQIIWHYPEICKGYNFNRKYDRLSWETAQPNLEAWQQGKTGIPIIDAAMRQLVQTGWMHNRLRMIVAMYLTKNLLIDWREGEKFFARHLVDLDFASNNGGWQWSASTGTDAAPYFRIFNPVTQSERFDPTGEFIKLYCPELRNLNAKQIHNPAAFLTATEIKGLGYPAPLVDLGATRLRAIERFKAV